jgi:hypothetical protein
MRKFITHPVVWILVVLIVAGILLSGSKQVSSFSWFATRTAKKNISADKNEYLQKKVDSSIVEDVIAAHSTLSVWNLTYGDIGKAGAVSSIPQYIAASQRILMIDIVSYLENAKDKQWALDSLIAQMTYYQNQWRDIKSQLQDVIQTKTLDQKTCASQKEAWDRNFYQWLREWDATTMAAWLESSKKWWACQAEAKIDTNAHTVLLRRVGDITTTMSSVSSLLVSQNTSIVANFALFKDNYLEKLLSLRNELRAKSPGTP